MTYNVTKIADELIKTALGEAYYGNAIYVTLDFPFLTEEHKRCLHRYLHGSILKTDHVILQNIANIIIEKGKEICVYPITAGRSQATPISSQMMTMERMIEERDDQLAELHKLNSELTDKANSYIVANAKLDAELTALRSALNAAEKVEPEIEELRAQVETYRADGMRLQYFMSLMEVCADGWVSDAIFIPRADGCCDLGEAIDTAAKAGPVKVGRDKGNWYGAYQAARTEIEHLREQLATQLRNASND